MIDDYRSTTISKNFIISQEDIIELAITDHLLWRWKIYNLILGFEEMSERNIGSPRESRLGQWYYGKGQEIVGNERAFKELKKPYMEVHEIAREAVSAYNYGEKAKAEEYLQQLSDVSHIVIEKLQALQTLIIEQKNLFQNK